MKRIASILTGLSLAVLFFVASAHAQFAQRMTATIPFEFTVGSISLPAGKYEFIHTDDCLYQVRDADRRSVLTLASASLQLNALPEKSTLKFATVEGRHVLVQIWNGFASNGNEFRYVNTSVEFAKHSTIEGTVTSRR